METAPLKDAHGRVVRYVRLSVTDRCNLRCMYCAHHMGLGFIPHDRILTYEEMLTVLDLLAARGVDKVRLTGGEPFVRKGFMGFVERIRERHPSMDIRITTNAVLLAPHAARLKALGVGGLNISFDTFNPETFRHISGSSLYEKARQGLEAALEHGVRVKLNAVAMRGINDHELPEFLAFAQKHAVDVRFIEYMPLGGRGGWDAGRFWSAEEVLATARQHATLTPIEDDHGKGRTGPAKMFSIAGGKGRFGLITAVSCHFCADCNRLRVTSEGSFRTCLFSDSEVPFRDLLRSGPEGVQEMMRQLEAAVQAKPLGFQLLQQREKQEAVIQRSMSSIGG